MKFFKILPAFILFILLFTICSSGQAAPFRYSIVNNTGSTVTYNGQAITNGSTFQIPQNQISTFSSDPSLVSDLNSGARVYLTDGTNPYTGLLAINYLKTENNQVLVNDNLGNGITSGSVGGSQALDTRAYLYDSSANSISSNNGSLNVNTKTATTANSAASVSVGVASTSILSSNASRKGLVVINLSSANISFGIGSAAVLNTGITLYPGGIWNMDEFSFTTAAINGIASSAASLVSVQEFQ